MKLNFIFQILEHHSAKDYGFTGMQYAIVGKMDNQIYSVLWGIIYQCTVNTILHKCTGDTNFGVCIVTNLWCAGTQIFTMLHWTRNLLLLVAVLPGLICS